MKDVPTNLSKLERKLDKFNIDKLVTVPVELSKLREVIKNDVAKKDIYNAKIKNSEDKILEIAKLAADACLHAKINQVKGGVSIITNLATNASIDAKINEVKGEIRNITSLATTNALTAVENKIPNVSN